MAMTSEVPSIFLFFFSLYDVPSLGLSSVVIPPFLLGRTLCPFLRSVLGDTRFFTRRRSRLFLTSAPSGFETFAFGRFETFLPSNPFPSFGFPPRNLQSHSPLIFLEIDKVHERLGPFRPKALPTSSHRRSHRLLRALRNLLLQKPSRLTMLGRLIVQQSPFHVPPRSERFRRYFLPHGVRISCFRRLFFYFFFFIK